MRQKTQHLSPEANSFDDFTTGSPHATRPKVTARNATKTFLRRPRQHVDALHDINLTVNEGEFCSIVGPSGCGKTTLLRIIAGLETLSGGEVCVVEDGDPTRPVNAMVFQEQSAFPWMTVEANVAYGLRSLGVSGRELRDRVGHWLDKTNLGAFAKAYPHQLSGGMKQRVSLARALAMEPSLILMDEPFAALDEQTKIVLQNELLELWHATGAAVVFITHSIDEAVALSDKVIVMSNRPATVKMVVDVPLERPRDVVELKNDPTYSALVTTIWHAIKDEVQKAVDAS